jgi:ABC-type transport system involved in multi-copper enzyme maturation permease subunit
MREVMAVADNLWHRILRLKVVYFLILCSLSLVWISVLYKDLMANHHQMLMVDVSLLLVATAGLISVLALPFDVPRELRDGVATTLLSKPLGRTHYLMGKFVGIVIVGLVVTGLITAGFVVIHKLNYPATDIWPALKAHLLTMASVIPMAAIALVFASLLNEAIAAILTFIAIFAFSALGAFPGLSKAVVIYGGIIPDLSLLNMRAEAAHGSPIAWGYVGLASVWCILYSVVLVSFAGIMFNRRDLK